MIQFGEEMDSVSGPMRGEGMWCKTEYERVSPEAQTHGPSLGRSSEETARVSNSEQLRCGDNLIVDSAVHGVHTRADRRDHGRRAQRDEAGEQRVLDQVLSVFLYRQSNKELLHLYPPGFKSWLIQLCHQVSSHTSCHSRGMSTPPKNGRMTGDGPITFAERSSLNQKSIPVPSSYSYVARATLAAPVIASTTSEMNHQTREDSTPGIVASVRSLGTHHLRGC